MSFFLVNYANRSLYSASIFCFFYASAFFWAYITFRFSLESKSLKPSKLPSMSFSKRRSSEWWVCPPCCENCSPMGLWPKLSKPPPIDMSENGFMLFPKELEPSYLPMCNCPKVDPRLAWLPLAMDASKLSSSSKSKSSWWLIGNNNPINQINWDFHE